MGTLRYIKPGDVVLLVLEPKTFVGDALELEIANLITRSIVKASIRKIDNDSNAI